ncbi:Protein of unknown function DUF241 [Macleaya cordata]|uniref:Uncharacterized protein n=1 Tax=Macleaya cordata TaxID=56857 RepID=A0A200QL99_MACCD|nr:Protein of unknown function DUF241 [Macleaya cordata]
MNSTTTMHVRSISLPTRSHPEFYRIDEDLKKVQTWESMAASTTPLKANTIQIGLVGLAELYNSFEDVLSLPLTKQALANNHQNKELVDEILDGSVRLLDIISTVKDILASMKEQVQDLQSAIRRKSSAGEINNKVGAYICFRKKVKKDISKCIVALKRMGNLYCEPSPSLEQDHLSMVVRLLSEVRVITISIFQHLLSFISASKPMKARNGRWALISKLMHKGRVACEGEHESTMSEVEIVDVAIFDAISAGKASSKDTEMEKLQAAQKWLEKLENGIEGLEAESEFTFRRLIQSRVSLLNIFSN